MDDVEGASFMEMFDGLRKLEGDLHAALPWESRALIAAAAVEAFMECSARDVFEYKRALIFMRRDET